MRKRIGIGVALLALLAFGYLYAQALQAQGGEVDKDRNMAAESTLESQKPNMSRTLKPCPDSPNCVSTQTDQAKKKRDPIPFTGTAEEARAHLKKVIGATPRTTLVQEESNYLHYTFKTWPIPYIDDVEFIIDPQAKVIHYRSASRVGRSDLGVNGRRMAKVVAAFAAAG